MSKEASKNASEQEKAWFEQVVFSTVRAFQVHAAMQVPPKPAASTPPGGQPATPKEPAKDKANPKPEEAKQDTEAVEDEAEEGDHKMEETDEPPSQSTAEAAKLDHYRLLDAWHRQKPVQKEGQSDEDFQTVTNAWLDQGPSPPELPPAPKRTRRTAVKGAAGASSSAAGAALAALALCG